MIYSAPPADDPIDQGDMIDDCPVLSVDTFEVANPGEVAVRTTSQRAIVLTQTCDLANVRTSAATVAEIFAAQFLIDHQLFKAADIKGPLRAGRVWGWYFLPADAALGLDEMVVDLRRLHTVRLDILHDLCRTGERRARIQPLYREHLAKHFADTFSRIGLPRPYETM